MIFYILDLLSISSLNSFSNIVFIKKSLLFKINASIKFHTGRQVTDSLVRNALNGNRGGSSSFGDSNSGSGGGSGFLNSLRYGGLFNENNGHGQGQGQNKPKVTVSGAGPGGTLFLTSFYTDSFKFLQ